MTLQKYALSIVAFAALLVANLSACGSDNNAGFDPTATSLDGGKGGDGSSGGEGDTICLLNNCDVDRDCADCTDGKQTCLQTEHRCIACQPGSSGTCKQGDYCTKYGDCVPNGTTCPEDAQGNPQVSCNSDGDCAACNPKHKVCDTGQHKCVGCLTTNVKNCQSTDACINDACVPKCPASCTTDNDCSQCGATGKEAHVCNAHKCAQCSPTHACANGGTCDVKHGVCEPSCGIQGRISTTPQCNGNQDCAGCKGGATSCDLPVNGGSGNCAVPAKGCSDFGPGALVLPAPFNTVTNLCSKDADCSNISADFNIGKALRDLTGFSSIGDSSIPFGMHACASVKIINHASCGVCVPCRVDSDCQDIDITRVAGDAFGPIGSVASKILLDKVFGPNDHKIHMYCDQVVGEYGVCLPCSDFLHACGDNQPQPPQAPCDHDICTTGGPLGTSCNQCTTDLCKNDPYCCTPGTGPDAGKWDELCKYEVDVYCHTATCLPDSCFGRDANTWYCSSLNQQDAYHCDDQTHVDQPFSCPTNQYCHAQSPGGPKDPAVLGGDGKPQCFPSP